MKKTYTKPQIIFDSFALSESIALGCEHISNHARGACTVTLGDTGDVLFLDAAIGCETTPADGDNSLCYDLPNTNSNVYTS